MICQQKCVQVGHIQGFYLVDPWQRVQRSYQCIPAIRWNFRALRENKYGITLSTCDCCPYKLSVDL
ncbi:hypothetical protein NP493_250g00000 [Ridgeia piscesae]|uniref:Uncharacterized protein n=1 Tax=Ridgeia piscesae TaxID=27915 RepID=A0AAD9NYJ9_RIDPI|nr:hypothetical protein NP493_250g00000 [Ridgeia piscesae]